MDYMNAKPTTVRFSADDLELIDAMAEHLSRSGVRHSRTDVLRVLLRKAQPADNAARWQRAYSVVFGQQT